MIDELLASLVISDLNGVPDEIYENLSQRVGSRNKGGMSSKLLAAKIATVATEVSTAHIMGGKQLTQKLSKLLRGVGFAAGTTIRAGKDKKAFLGVLTKSLGMAYQMCKNVQTIGRQSHWGTDRVFEQPAS